MSHTVWYQDGSFSVKTTGRNYIFFVCHRKNGRTYWSSYSLRDESLQLWITDDYGELVRYDRIR